MAVFNEINTQRKAAGLPELTWSDDLYNSTTLLHAKNISHRYNSDGIVYRRESDGSVVFVTFSWVQMLPKQQSLALLLVMLLTTGP